MNAPSEVDWARVIDSRPAAKQVGRSVECAAESLICEVDGPKLELNLHAPVEATLQLQIVPEQKAQT